MIKLTLFAMGGGVGYGPTWSRNLFCIYSIIAKLSSSWQVKLQLHLNWDSYIITVRKCTPYPPHHPPTRASILAMFYKLYCNWNWVYEPVVGFNPNSHRGRGGYGPTWSRNLFCMFSIIAKLSSSWQVKLQLHLNWDSLIITVRKCTPYPPHHPPTRTSILAMFYKHYCNWNWVYGPLGWFGYKLTLSPAGGGVDMAPFDQEIYFVFILLLPSSVPVGKSSFSSTWTETSSNITVSSPTHPPIHPDKYNKVHS